MLRADPVQMENFGALATISLSGGFVVEKPSLDEVLKYAKMMARKCIAKSAKNAPEEHRTEMEQECYLRVIEAYPRIEAQDWRSFVYNHCRGAVLDFSEDGDGFSESSKSLKESAKNWKIEKRVSLSTPDGQEISIDQILGSNGKFSDFDMDKIKINWDLACRMASMDECLRAFLMHIRGITLEEGAKVINLKRARIAQLKDAFVARFDDPEHADCHWFKQCCFALGICELLGMAAVDQSEVLGFSVGWHLTPVDLDNLKEHQEITELKSQMNFFGEEEVVDAEG